MSMQYVPAADLAGETAGEIVPMYPEPEAGVEERSWDAFWAEVKGSATTTIRGVEIRIPTGLTLGAKRQLEQRSMEGGVEAWAPIAVELFRAADQSVIPDLWERWRTAGMELDELETLVAWGMSHGKGHPISFAEAHEAQQVVASMGKGPMPTTRTASSDATGGPSKPRSARRTASKRTPSPA